MVYLVLLVHLVSWITKYQRNNTTQTSELLIFVILFFMLTLIESSNVYSF